MSVHIQDSEEEERRIQESMSKKKPQMNKTFSFGNTANEKSLLFLGGEVGDDAKLESVPSQQNLQSSEGEPLIPKDKTDIVGASNWKTFVNIIKSFVGTGILFLPSAFRDGGIVFSSIILSVVAGICLWGMLLLVLCWEQGRGSFGEIAERAYGKPGKILIDGAIVLAQFSIGCVYLVFIAETFLQVTELDWPLSYVILMEIPILTPLVWIRHVYKLSIASFLGTMCIVFGACYITYYDIYTISTKGVSDVEYFNSKDFALFLGTAIFTFEGIGTVIPIQQSMREKQNFKRLLTVALIVISVILTVFAILGYLAFGSNVKGPIILNLPEDDIFVKIILSLYAVAIIFSYPLIVFPGVEILQKIFFKPGPVTTARKWQKNFFRFILVCICAGIAIGGGEDFEKFVSLVGGFACTPLGLIFPPLFHYKLVAQTRFEKISDIFLVILGTAMGVFATVYSAYAWATE